MQHRTGATLVTVVVLLVATRAQPLEAQTRQEQVAAERARTEAADVKACPLLTNADIRGITGRTDPWELNDEPYDMGSACDWSGIVTLRIYSSAQPEEEVAWTLQNYKKENESKTPISGFGAGAYIMFLTPRDEYEDAGAILVGRAGPRMFMISLTAPDGMTAQSLQPQLVQLADLVVSRLN